MTANIWNPGYCTPLVASDRSYTFQSFVASEGQTAFNITEFAYVPDTNSLAVYVNGVRTFIGFSETSESVVTFDAGLPAGTVVAVDGFVGAENTAAAAGSAAAALVSETAAASSASNALNSEVAAAASEQSAAADLVTVQSLAGSGFKQRPARNCALNQNPVSQGTSTRTGFSATRLAGSTAGGSVVTGVDMSTGDFGGLVWLKNRDAVESHALIDTVRGGDKLLSSDSTAADTTNAQFITAFNSDGFTYGTALCENNNHIAWSWQTNKKTTGLTNRGKAYTCHYNAELGFSITKRSGDGAGGHELPHHLSREPELSIFKNRDGSGDWPVFSTLLDDNYLRLNSTAAQAEFGPWIATDNVIVPTNSTLTNDSGVDYIAYHFASIPGVSKVGKYVGTGAAGNHVECGFQPAWLLFKNISDSGHWIIIDATRGEAQYLLPNSTQVDTQRYPVLVEFTSTGFTLLTGDDSTNGANIVFIFLAMARSDSDANKAWGDYPYPTDADTLTINQDTLISFAEGFNALGQEDSVEQVGAGVTYDLGVGHENKHYWFYKDKGGSYGVTENEPVYGLTAPSPAVSDYYLITEGKMYNSAGTEIQRTYLAEIWTNSDGEVSRYENLPVARQMFDNVRVYGNLTSYGNLQNSMVPIARVIFDGTTSPPSVVDSVGVKYIYSAATGEYAGVLEDVDDFDLVNVTPIASYWGGDLTIKIAMSYYNRTTFLIQTDAAGVPTNAARVVAVFWASLRG